MDRPARVRKVRRLSCENELETQSYIRKELAMSKREDSIVVGLDVHKSAINVSVILPGSKKVNEQWQIVNERRAVERMLRKIKRIAKGELECCYEAGPCGYTLQRELGMRGVSCVVVAPSLIPMKPGERVQDR